MAHVARGGAPLRVRGVRRAPARAAGAVHAEERRRDRRAALQLRRQGRPRGRAAPRDDADGGAHGRARAPTRCASRCAGSRCRSCSATSASRRAACASTSSSTSTSSARPTSTADAELRGVRGRHHARVRARRRSDVVVRVSDRRLLQAYLRVARRARRVGRRGVYGVIDKLERQPAAGIGREARRRSACLATRSSGSSPIADVALRRARGATRRSSTAAAAGRRVRRASCATYRRCSAATRLAARRPLDRARTRVLHRASCSSCSTERASFARSAAAGGTTRCSQSLGGADLPALGFGMGDVVLGELLRAQGADASPTELERRRTGSPARTTCRSSRSWRRRHGFARRRARRWSTRCAPQSLSKQKKARAGERRSRAFVTSLERRQRNG